MQASDKNYLEQEALNRYFTDEASYWEEIYQSEGVKEFVHQQRLRLTLHMIDQICPLAGSRVLDVGCGAGIAATTLAERGYIVDAIDPVEAMVDLTCARAKKCGVESRLKSRLGNVYSLPFADNTFAIVVAMGVLPWLASVKEPLNELRRVLQPGGHIIVTVDNKWALEWFLEPLTNPILRPAKEFAKSILRRFGYESTGVKWYLTSCAKFDAALVAAGLEKVCSTRLGFGPFTFFDRELLSRRAGLKVHHALQRLADHGVPVLRSSGLHYLVMAKKGVETWSD
jgi:ubiquinone/menaquinone biosynthesis C-methylase UbiE